MSSVHLRLEDEGAPDFAAEVIEVLNLTLATSSPISVSAAATSLDRLCSQYYAARGEAGSFIWWFWDLVHGLARQVPYDSPQQDALAAVVKALHDLPPKTVYLGESWGAGELSFVQLWTGLPLFANTFREKLDEVDSEASGEAERKERVVNLQTYGARIAGLGLVPFEVYAIWALVDALEGTMTPIRGAPDEINEDVAAVEDLSYKVRIAAVWMIYCGHILYGRDEEIPGATAGPLWRLSKKEATALRRKLRGTDGLSLQRWQMWKNRFAAIRDRDSLEAKVRTKAGDAYSAMEKAETC